MTTDELRRLLAEATPGPWTVYDNLTHPAEWWIASCGMGEGRATVWSVNPPTPEDAPGHRTDDGGAADERNAALIVAAVNVLPAHLDVIEAARRRFARLATRLVVARPGLLRVEDTGPGLEDADRDRAFERFYLHERYGRERSVGTGLGLAIVKELTEAMGGTVSVESEPGRFTTFTIRLGTAARIVSRA